MRPKKRTSQANTAEALLDSLIEDLSPTIPAPHKWQTLADRISEGNGIKDITSRSVTVDVPDGDLTIDVEGGWTEQHYDYLLPVLTATSEPQLNKAIVAKAVLLSTLQKLGCAEPDTAWWLLRKAKGIDEGQWLPQYVADKGFLAITADMMKALADHRKANPRPHIPKNTKPRWDVELRRLCIGDIVIKQYKQPAKNQIRVLESFQTFHWRRRIPNPLVTPGEPTARIQQRRRETIAALNDDHVTPGIIRFGGDGRKTDIKWEWCE